MGRGVDSENQAAVDGNYFEEKGRKRERRGREDGEVSWCFYSFGIPSWFQLDRFAS